MREGRKPRRRAVAEPGQPAEATTPGLEGDGERLQGGSNTAGAEDVAGPTGIHESAGLMVVPSTPDPASQLSFESLDQPASRPGMAEDSGSADTVGSASSEGPLGLDEFEEPDEAADLLVSITTESLDGAENLDETVEAEENITFADEEAGDGVAEWAYPEAAGDATYVSRSDRDMDQTEDLEDTEPAGTQDADARVPAYEPEETIPLDRSGLQIRLARIHLRTGSLFMARAELESLAARRQLDAAAHLDLAETRWRTGDLQGAGEAATAYLENGGQAGMGFVITAEAFALAGRHADARRQAESAMERLPSELESVFAGMPRHATWPGAAVPSDAATAAATDTVGAEAIAGESAIESEPEPPVGRASAPANEAAVAREAAEPARAAAPAGATPSASEPEVEPGIEPLAPVVAAEPEVAGPEVAGPGVAEPAGPAATLDVVPSAVETAPAVETADAVEAGAAPRPAEPPPAAPEAPPPAAPEAPTQAGPETPAVAAELPSLAPHAAPEESGASAEVTAGRSFLAAGDPMMAALHFGVAIRLAPVSAEAVLESIGDRSDLPLQLVRGDALRLLGLEADAGNTYLSVASALGAGKAPISGQEPRQPRVGPHEDPVEQPPATAAAAREPQAGSAPEPAPAAESKPVAPPVADELPPLRWE